MKTAAVIGGGHNGLVCAAYLARAGLDVTVFEANAEPGGCVWTETTASGYRLERGAIDHGLVLDVAEDLSLADHDLDYVFRDVLVGAKFADGESMLFHDDLEKTVEGLGLSTADGDGYRRLAAMAGALFDLIGSFESAPNLADLAAFGAHLDEDPVALLLTSADKLIGRHIADRTLRAALTMYGAHAQLPPWLPGTGLFGLLLPASHGHAPGRPLGGSDRLIKALVSAISAAGGEVRTSASVTGVSGSGGGATVHVEGGDQIEVDCVVSSIDVVRTVALLDGPPESLARAARRSVSGSLNIGELKLDLALSATHTPGTRQGSEAIWMLQPEPKSLDRSFGHIVAGEMPAEASMMWAAPSALDSTAAPEGHSTAWISAFVPAVRRDRPWDDAAEAEAAEWMLGGFEAITGIDLRPDIVESRVTGPTGWEARTGAEGGNPNHIDQTIDQMMAMRPPTRTGYRTELPWLFLSGAGAYPGGGLSGLPGRNAAMAVLGGSEGKRRRFSDDLAAMRRGWHLFRTLRSRN